MFDARSVHSSTSFMQRFDAEKQVLHTLANTSVDEYVWNNCCVEVTDRVTKRKRKILDDVSGNVRAGELIALMGPSGSGKTTLLNVLSQRPMPKSMTTSADLLVNGRPSTESQFREIASFVEQEDILIGSLTARETIDFSARFARNRTLSDSDRKALVEQLLSAFGLGSCADTLIGTPIRKGVSGGQKRRISVASQLVTGGKILLLDEPTSGLDSTASREVIRFISGVAQELKLLVIVCIHQPSPEVFSMFDRLLLLSGGKTCYFGAVSDIPDYLQALNIHAPPNANLADFLLEITNPDFDQENTTGVQSQIQLLQSAWRKLNHQYASTERYKRNTYISIIEVRQHERHSLPSMLCSFVGILETLLRRSFIKSYRDVLAFGIRYIMFVGLAIMMGTVWLRLQTSQEYIYPYINAISFAIEFMSFMAVAYVPAFLEDRAVYVKDRANGLYGPFSFLLVHFAIGLPYLFGMSLSFSIVVYFLTNFQPTALAFFTWTMWFFLELVAAESLLVFIASLTPNFIMSLVLIASANGLWMSAGGFVMPTALLNPFYRYALHYIDFQAYVFKGILSNEFKDRTYSCGEDCRCIYPTGDLVCEIPGSEVIKAYGFGADQQGQWIAIMICIVLVYRLLAYLALRYRRA